MVPKGNVELVHYVQFLVANRVRLNETGDHKQTPDRIEA
jgi:hypothetical protein